MSERLTPDELFRLALDAGFQPQDAITATGLALVESSGNPEAVNPSSGATGLWQIREPNLTWLVENGSRWGLDIDSADELTNPAKNALAAYLISQKVSWNNPEKDKRPGGQWADWAEGSRARLDQFTLWAAEDTNTVTAIEAGQAAFHRWTNDDSDVLTPEEVGGFGVPGSYASSTSADELREDKYRMGLTRPFADRFNRFVENSGGAVEPLQGRIDPNEYKTVYNSLTQSDPELAAEMGNVHESPFIRGNAAMVHYPVNDQWAMKNASRYGLRLRPGFNNIVEPTGLRHKNRPTDFSTMSSDQIRNHLMEIIEGAVQPDIDDDRNPEALSLDAPLLANQSPTPQIDPTAFRDPDKARSSWDEAVDWWLSHNFFDEDVPSGGGLMVGPQEMAKLGNFLKDALLPLMAGDIGLAGVGGLGPFDPVPVPFGQIVGKGAKGAKGAWRAIRGVDEAAEAVSAVVRAGDDLTPSLLRSQGFLGDARLAPTRNIGEGVTVSEVAATQTDLSSLGQIGGPTPDARPFVVVRKADGSLQPFYQSTGDWSGMAGAWLPFDGFGGVVNDAFHRSWYRKNRFGQDEFARGTPLHRFGSEENKTLSELLGRELGDAEPTILFDMEGVDTESFPGMSYEDLNEALGTYSDYGDYLAATVDESPTFTGNPMRVETPAGPTVIDLDAPQPDLPPGTALGPDGEVIQIIGLEDDIWEDSALAGYEPSDPPGVEGPPGRPDQFGPEDDIPLVDTLNQISGAGRYRAMMARGRAEARTWFDNLSDEDQAAAILEWEKSSKPHYIDPDHVFDPADDYDVRNAYTAARRAGEG